MHDNGHTHTHEEHAAESKSRQLLHYTIEHSVQHAEELKALASKLIAEGKGEAAALIDEASAVYERANETLRGALRKL